jgi:putative PIN family toxin of toxin-antitoxin system
LLLALRDGAFELVVSPLLLAELHDVLMRPKFRPYVAETEVDAYVALIRQESVVVEDPEPSPAGISGDPDDEFLIDLARAARVDALVSGDAHLLDLRDSLPVRSPREFLDELSGTTST